jgi:16S rRNA (guanine966-N2)-methyltransferase
MRIIRGIFKGRQIHAPGNLPVRPTTDFAKEGLFNILEQYVDFEGLEILDLFSGTGNISYEFASRGASKLNCVDINFHCVQFINQTFELLKLSNARAHKNDVFKYIRFCKDKFGLIFADPPYAMENVSSVPDEILKYDLLNEGGILIVEHEERVNFKNHPNYILGRNYGKVNFSFFSKIK